MRAIRKRTEKSLIQFFYNPSRPFLFKINVHVPEWKILHQEFERNFNILPALRFRTNACSSKNVRCHIILQQVSIIKNWSIHTAIKRRIIALSFFWLVYAWLPEDIMFLYDQNVTKLRSVWQSRLVLIIIYSSVLIISSIAAEKIREKTIVFQWPVDRWFASLRGSQTSVKRGGAQVHRVATKEPTSPPWLLFMLKSLTAKLLDSLDGQFRAS